MAAITSISAVTLAVTDMARAVAFYEALGFRALFGGAGATFTSLQAGDQYLNLSVEGTPVPSGWGRVIFYVDDVDTFHDQLRARGLAPDFDPRDASWGERYFHIADPDGHELSFARPLSGEPRRERP